MATKKQANLINMDATIKHMRISIEGDGDLILNKMSDPAKRALDKIEPDSRKKNPNKWEHIITSVHWLNPVTIEDGYNTCDEEMMHRLLEENKPCITTFGLKQSFGQAVVRNKIEQYRTNFDVAMNVVPPNGLVPITFDSWSVEERYMDPTKGSPVKVWLNHFHNWKAQFQVDYTDAVYTRDQLLNFIIRAGFGLGIGSGRSSGYGRYHIVKVEE